MICANEIFDGADDIMTVIPEYVFESLGIPLMSDFGNYAISSSNEVEARSDHFYAVEDEDCIKIETISRLDIEDETTLIFCNSIEKVEWLSSKLRQRHLWPQTMVMTAI